jgi:hypothetical protein
MLSNLLGRKVALNLSGRTGEIVLIVDSKTGVLFYILMANNELEAKYHSDFRLKD